MCYALLLVTVLLAADADSQVKEIVIKETEFESFAEALHIIQKSGSVELSGDVPTARIEIELYMTSGGGFGPEASNKDRIPIFWMIDGQTASVIGGNTPEAVVKNNPKGDFAIVYIRLSR